MKERVKKGKKEGCGGAAATGNLSGTSTPALHLPTLPSHLPIYLSLSLSLSIYLSIYLSISLTLSLSLIIKVVVIIVR